MDKLNIRLDPDNLTIGDLEDFEEGVGKPLYEALKPVPVRDDEGNRVLGADGRPEMSVNVSAKALRYLVWITQRATNPDFTIEDARNVKVAALELVGDDDSDGQGNDDAPGDTTG